MCKAKALIRRLRRLTQINGEVICIASFTDAKQFPDFAFNPFNLRNLRIDQSFPK